MGLKISENMHLMDIDEIHQLFLKQIILNISIQVWGIYFAKHEFGVFTILPKYHSYS
jgi:hypothetical protein